MNHFGYASFYTKYMVEKAPDDAKAREASYSHVLEYMENPTSELLDSLRLQLPRFLCDSNSSCQRIALSICDQFFKHSTDINYAEYADILLHNCFKNHPEHTMSLVDQCFRADYSGVSPLVYENMVNRPPSEIKYILAIIISYLATLNQKEANEVNDIIKHVTPLTNNKDESIRKEAIAAIDSAKIVCGQDVEVSMSEDGSTPKTWQALLKSENWKERKQGYTLLLDLIQEPNSKAVSLISVDKGFYTPAASEKHIACMNIVLDIISRMAVIFKSQMARKLREYLSIIINMMSQRKNPRLTSLQSSFDDIAACVVSNPFEPPFLEQFLKMINSSNARLKEEALLFISRNSNYHMTNQINEIVKNLTSDPSQNIRELATAVLNGTTPNLSTSTSNIPSLSSTISYINNNNLNDSNDSSDLSRTQRTRSKSPENLKRTFRSKKAIAQNLQSQFNSWINSETLELLNSSQWISVTKGLENLRKQFDTNKTDKSAVVSGLTSLFTGRTFTPKVMTNLFQNVQYYLAYSDNTKLNDESVVSTVNFCIDKIVDKRFETTIFDILETCCSLTSSGFVFDQLFPQTSNKNPVVISRVVSFLAYHIEKVGSTSNINFNEVANQIKPLFTHGDPNVRKAASDCGEALSRASPNTNFNLPSLGSTNSISLSTTGNFGNSLSTTGNANSLNTTNNLANMNDNDSGLIPQKLIISIGKTSSILECRKGLEDIELLLNDVLNKRGCSTVQSKEFNELFTRVRPWFKDSNTNIVLSVAKVVLLAIQLTSDVTNVPVEFLTDIVLLLNFVNKGIRQTTIQILEQLDDMMSPFFVPKIFIPSFYKLNIDGRKAGIIFVRDLVFDMYVNEVYTPFIVNILSDKSEDFRNSAMPLIQRFLALPDAEQAIRNEIDSYPPAQKSSIITIMSGIEPDDSTNVRFSKTYTERAQTARGSHSQGNNLGITSRPFSGKPRQPSPDSARARKFSMTSKNLNGNSNNNGNTGGGTTGEPGKSSIPIKSSIPVRKNEEGSNNSPIRVRKGSVDMIRRKSDDSLSDSRSSIPTLKNKQLNKQEPEFPINEPIPQKHNNYDNNANSNPNKINNSNLNSSINSQNSSNSNLLRTAERQMENGVCRLNDALTQKISDPTIYVYQWIADLNSSDLARINLSTKAILKHLKNNSSIFIIHVEGLSASLICKLHSYLMVNPIPEALVKILILCLFHIFYDPKLYKKVPKEFVQQIVYEACSHISLNPPNPTPNTNSPTPNTNPKTMFHSEFTNLMCQMIESLPLFTFSSLLLAIGELVEWTPVALKFFERCGEKVMMIGNNNNAIFKALLMVDKFFVVHPKETLVKRNPQLGEKVIKILEDFINRIGESFGDLVNQKETVNKFPQNSTVLPLLAMAKKRGAPVIPTPRNSNALQPGKPSSPLQKPRVTLPNS